MFQQLSDFQMGKNSYRQLGDDAWERQTAQRKYDSARRKAWFYRLQATFRHDSRRLYDLSAVKAVQQQHYRGTQTVSLDEIRGSENRTREFDIDFYPVEGYIEERWISVAAALLRGIQLPPVELIKVGDMYYVRDGHHRISVARALGWKSIDAVVTEWSGEYACGCEAMC